MEQASPSWPVAKGLCAFVKRRLSLAIKHWDRALSLWFIDTLPSGWTQEWTSGGSLSEKRHTRIISAAAVVLVDSLSPELLQDLQADWAELTEAAKASKVTDFHALTRSGRSSADNPAAVRDLAATLHKFPSLAASRHPRCESQRSLARENAQPRTGTSRLASPRLFRRWPSMPDAATLAFALTYAETLAVGALMFFGQFAAFTIFLALAGLVRLLALPVHALTRRADR